MWTWQGVTPAGVPVCDLADARGRSVTIPLEGAPTATWTTTGNSASALRLGELTHDIIARRDGVSMFRGRIGATQDSLGDASHSVSWNAVGYLAALARRVAWPGSTLSWTTTDQALIVKDLIDDTQALPDGNLGIDTSGLTATGRTRDYTVDLGKGVADAIADLGAMVDGTGLSFDFSIEPDMTAHIYPHGRGSTVAWSAVWGVNVSSITRTVDPTAYASDIVGIGDPSTTPHVSSRTPRILGRWELAESWSDVTIQSTLNAHADGALILADWYPSYELTLSPGVWTPADAWLGDTIGVHVTSGRLDVHTTGRIMAVKFDIDDQNVETVTLTLDRVIPNLKDRLGVLGGRVGNLERR